MEVLAARLELFERHGLLRAHLAGLDVGDEEILATDGAAGEAAQQGQLAHMGERVGSRPLEQLLDRSVERPAGGQEGIEGLERLEEALLLLGPGARLGDRKSTRLNSSHL